MDDNEDNNDMIWCPDCSSVVLGEHNCSAFSNNFENKNDYLEALIAAVFERESLWNSALPYKFRGPSETKALWSEIDGCLNTAPDTSQAKWKNLRDRFVKEHSLQCTYIPSGSKAIKKKSNWPFYESLRFLVPTINYRKTKSNIENVHPNVLSPSAEQKEEFNFSSVPGVSSRKENNISQQSISQSTSSLLKSQNFQSKQISYQIPQILIFLRKKS
ncbi:uncharacterized protein [Linepithema humile]|uniref:uncharacterized protein n=1 Tax=Linepithema humile TaxID=83485 RepID=UPI00351E0BC6